MIHRHKRLVCHIQRKKMGNPAGRKILKQKKPDSYSWDRKPPLLCDVSLKSSLVSLWRMPEELYCFSVTYPWRAFLFLRVDHSRQEQQLSDHPASAHPDTEYSRKSQFVILTPRWATMPSDLLHHHLLPNKDLRLESSVCPSGGIPPLPPTKDARRQRQSARWRCCEDITC